MFDDTAGAKSNLTSLFLRTQFFTCEYHNLKISICDQLSENPALPTNIEFELEAIFIRFQLNSDYCANVLQVDSNCRASPGAQESTHNVPQSRPAVICFAGMVQLFWL